MTQNKLGGAHTMIVGGRTGKKGSLVSRAAVTKTPETF